jgi:short-subunit dehydrogenase
MAAPFSARLPVLTAVASVLLFSGCAHLTGNTAAQSPRGKVVVVTGASSGFGRGTALALAQQGASVVLAARRTEVLEEVARECETRGGQALVVTTDVADATQVERLARAAVERFGRIDVWINNAGVGVISRFEDAPVEDYSRLVDVNLKGVIYGSHVAVRQFRTQGGGTLVNIGSVDSAVPHAYQAAYSATKAGVLSLGRALNEELRLNGLGDTIKVATVLPWAVDTPFWRHAANYTGKVSRMAAMDDPQKVVAAIVRVSFRPQEELAVGWKAKGATFSERVLPDLTERISANIAHASQIKNPPPGAATPGSVHQPMLGGTGVDDGIRARMAEERRERKTGASAAETPAPTGR